MKTIKLLQPMTSSVTTGQKTIPAGTVMTKFFSQLSWEYFRGDGFELVLMGWAEDSKLESQGKLIIL